MIYALVFFGVIVNTYLYIHVKRGAKKKWPFFFLVLAFSLIVFLSAFRGHTGTDTINIYKSFYNRYMIDDIEYPGREIGFYWLYKIGYFLFNSYEGVLFVIAFVIWFNFFYVIKYYKNLKINLVLYVVFLLSFCLAPSMNIMRQMIAASFFLVATTKIFDRKFWQYFLWIIIASLFHTSAIVLLPVYFLYVDIDRKKSLNSFYTLIICALPVFFFLFFNIFINLSIFSKYKEIYGNSLIFDFRPQRLIVRLPLYIMEVYVFIKSYKKITSKDAFFIKLILLEIVSLFIGYFSLWAYRFLYYFAFGHILFITNISEKYTKNNKLSIIFIFLMYFIAYFFVSHIILKYDEIYPFNLIE